jgi:Flp pilus assembly protein TadG
MRRFRKSLRSDARGQASVEFLLTVFFLIIIVLWVFEMVFFFYTWVLVADAAKEGVRYAVVHGSGNSSPSGPTNDDAAVIARVNNFANYPGMTVHVNYLDSSNAAPNRVQVTVSYPYATVFGVLGWSPPTIRAAAEGRIMN